MDNPSEGSVTHWIKQLLEGDDDAAPGVIFEQFHQRIVRLARARLQSLPAYEDEDDVAASVLRTFFRRVEEGKFKGQYDRESLWSLLAAITFRKAKSLQRKHFAARRDVRRQAPISTDGDPPSLDEILGEANLFLETLRDPKLVAVTRHRLEGRTIDEISKELGMAGITVKRKLAVVKNVLRDQLARDDA